MKGTLAFDPATCDYGPATTAIRQILVEWADIDWFEAGADTELATSLLIEHNARARVLMAEKFAEPIRIEPRKGGWEEFRAFCTRVRGPDAKWDWKHSGLKMLSKRHSDERGWSLKDHAPPMAVDRILGASNLFLRFKDIVVWHDIGPRLAFKDSLAAADAAEAAWYRSYAAIELTQCIEWQLVEQTSAVESNPFVPLLRCYAARCYPFALAADEFVLFEFSGQ